MKSNTIHAASSAIGCSTKRAQGDPVSAHHSRRSVSMTCDHLRPDLIGLVEKTSVATRINTRFHIILPALVHHITFILFFCLCTKRKKAFEFFLFLFLRPILIE